MTILELAKKYNAFQQKVGGNPNYEAASEIPILFTEGFKKIANGALLVSNSSGLIKQLEEVRKAAGSWQIAVKELLPCTDNLHCTIRYHLISNNLGTFDVIAILKSTLDGLLEEVSEVYYQCNSN